MKTLSKRDRVLLSLSSEKVDKVPYSFWGHHPPEDKSVDGIVKVQLDWHDNFDMDFMKVMFKSTWCLEDWGCEFGDYHSDIGYWLWEKYPINQPEDWEKLSIFDPDFGTFGEQLEVLKRIKEHISDDAPILATIFSPLMVAAQLASDDVLFHHIHNHPEAVHAGLTRITKTLERFTESCFKSGADGVFYATQYAQKHLIKIENYFEFGDKYDQLLLNIIEDYSIFTLLHLHGDNLMFELSKLWPVHAVNWYDQAVTPSLKEGKDYSQKCVVGGIDHEKTLLFGPEESINSEVKAAIHQCSGQGVMIAPGCAVSLKTPIDNYYALKNAVESINIFTLDTAN